MLGRRERRLLRHRARDAIWPRIGWRRAASYFSHRVRRLPGSPYSIAAGFACGAAISFTPFLGFHFLIAALTSWLIGASVIAAAIGTVVGNPWTFPFIWVAAYRLGCLLLGLDTGEVLPHGLSMEYIFANPEAVLLPMTVGGLPMAIVVWCVSFWLVRRAVARYQRMRKARIRRKVRRRQRKREAALKREENAAKGDEQ
ncbi:MAG: DUF2062 domain-containing protein [Alphaproteobacteria bacterium]|nr:DUF2062 domain-containing protein [Alphaproteobacteria bacterium]